MDEIEGESDDEVFEGDEVETEEKHKGKKNKERVETKGEKELCGECKKPVTWVSEGAQCIRCEVWRHLKRECSGLLKGRRTTNAKLMKYECQPCIRGKERDIDASPEKKRLKMDNINQKKKKEL